MAIAKVEPLVTARALRGPFDYRLPPEMEHLGVGSVLRVPFGRDDTDFTWEKTDRSDALREAAGAGAAA